MIITTSDDTNSLGDVEVFACVGHVSGHHLSGAKLIRFQCDCSEQEALEFMGYRLVTPVVWTPKATA